MLSYLFFYLSGNITH